MKKNFSLSYVCVLFCFLGTIVSCSDSEMKSDNNIPVEDKKLSITDMINNLGNSFLPPSRSVPDQEFFVYPDYYGGMYVGKDDKLVVLVTQGDTAAYKRDITARCNSSYFEMKICRYPLSFLQEICSKISDVSTDLLADLKVYYWGIDEEKNRVMIMTGDMSESNIKQFKSLVIDSPAIEFCESTPVTFCAETLTPGTGGYEKTGPGWGSVGFRCKYQNKAAFVTSGHVMHAVAKVFYKDETMKVTYGTCVACDATDRDIAICTPSTGVTLENTFNYNGTSITLATNSTLPSASLPVRLKGKNSQTEGSIKLSSTGFPNRTYKYFAAGDFASSEGDSGGIVFSKKDNTIVGILMAIATASVNGVPTKLSFFVPYSAIEGKYGITLY